MPPGRIPGTSFFAQLDDRYAPLDGRPDHLEKGPAQRKLPVRDQIKRVYGAILHGLSRLAFLQPGPLLKISRVHRVKGINHGDHERPGCLRPGCGHLARKAEKGKPGRRGFHRIGRSAAKAAIVAVAAQPVPVTFPIIGWPLLHRMTLVPSVIRSTLPVTAITELISFAVDLAISATCSTSCSESTPLVTVPEEAMGRISEAFPRTTVNFRSLTIFLVVSVLREVAPSPDRVEHDRHTYAVGLLPGQEHGIDPGVGSVPMLITSALASDTISSTSFGA